MGSNVVTVLVVTVRPMASTRVAERQHEAATDRGVDVIAETVRGERLKDDGVDRNGAALAIG